MGGRRYAACTPVFCIRGQVFGVGCFIACVPSFMDKGETHDILRVGILPGVTLGGGGVTTPQVKMVGECSTHALAGLFSNGGDESGALTLDHQFL